MMVTLPWCRVYYCSIKTRQEVGHGKLLELQLAKAVMAEKSGTAATPAVRRPSRLTQAARQRCPECKSSGSLSAK